MLVPSGHILSLCYSDGQTIMLVNVTQSTLIYVTQSMLVYVTQSMLVYVTQSMLVYVTQSMLENSRCRRVQ